MPTRRPPQHSPELAASFQDGSVARAYRHRAPYPPAVFDTPDLGGGAGER